MSGPEQQPVSAAPERSLLIIAAATVALVVVAVLAVIILGTRSGADFAADTPEGVVQRYLAAFEDEDHEAAYEYFSSEVQAELSLDEYRRMVREYGMYGPGSSRRVIFDRVSGDGDRRQVHLTVEEFYGGGPFGGGDVYRSSRQLALVREAGEWRIDESLIGFEPGYFDR
jgi:hypothetical protein